MPPLRYLPSLSYLLIIGNPRSFKFFKSSALPILLTFFLFLFKYCTWEKSNELNRTCPTVIPHKYSSREHQVLERRKSTICPHSVREIISFVPLSSSSSSGSFPSRSESHWYSRKKNPCLSGLVFRQAVTPSPSCRTLPT